MIEREKEYKIEKILNKQDVKEKPKYLVRWKGYSKKRYIGGIREFGKCNGVDKRI